MAGAVKLEPLPPREALAFFRKKGLAAGFHWQDIWQEEHAVAFTVAKAMRVDILEDIRGALDDALAKGETFEAFKSRLTPILQEKGWWGQQRLVDPTRPEGGARLVQLGSPRRLRTIYDTNLRMAHAAGRWDKIERLKGARPYLRYVTMDDGRVRPEHVRWHGTVLPVDDPWWDTHYPPNGWGCRCLPQQLSASDLERLGYSVKKPPEEGDREFRNKRSGEVTRVPDGIDPGFGYNVGKARMRAFTPPPMGGLPTSFPPGVQRPPLPPPSPAPRSLILEEGLRPQDYAEAFLNEFGASTAKPAMFTDKVGEAVVVSKDLFQDGRGRWKADKAGRGQAMKLLALSVKDPDEIWWQWSQDVANGPWRLKRRYIRRWDLPEGGEALAVFDWHKDGWHGATAFPAGQDTPEKRLRYIERQRGGLLAYRRPIAG